MFDRMTNSETLQVEVAGSNKGGLLCYVERLRGFIPKSHLAANHSLGESIQVMVIEADCKAGSLVFSETQALQVMRYSSNPREHLKKLNNLSHDEIPVVSNPPEKSVVEEKLQMPPGSEQLLREGFSIGNQFFVSKSNKSVLLDTQFKLLRCLWQHCGQIVSNKSLAKECGSEGISNIVANLNKKVSGISIKNIRGEGYRLEEDKV